MNEHSDYLSLFSEDDVRLAAELVTRPHEAAQIAADFAAIPLDERPEYGWTEWGIELLAMASPSLLRKVQELWGGSEAEWHERAAWIRHFRDRGEYSEGFGLEDIVVR